MKRLLTVLLAVVLLTASCAWAEEAEPIMYTSGDWKYVLLADGTAEIVDYNGKAKELTVPAELDGYVVTSIGAYAFNVCASLQCITLPDSVTSIGARAFDGCWSLRSIVLPDRLTSIGDFAFSGCDSLTNVTIPESVTAIGGNPFIRCARLTEIVVSPEHPVLATIDGVLFEKTEKRLVTYPCAFGNSSYMVPNGIRIIGDSAFFSCIALECVTLPDSLTAIGDSAFCRCSSLTNITLPDSVTSIGNKAFDSCSALTGVTLSDNLMSIGDQAFASCSSLTRVTIPESVTAIGINPFDNCKKLTEIIVAPEHPVLATIDGVLFEKTEKRLVTYPCAFSADSYVVPTGIRIIGAYAFRYCFSLTNVTLPETVTNIGESAFASCTSLASVTLPASLTAIDRNAFWNCGSITFTVPRDSWAARWCKDNSFRYTFPDALDWLLD